MANITDIDHKKVARAFNKSIEGMRKLKRKHEKDYSHLWVIYCKAYHFDVIKALINKEIK